MSAISDYLRKPKSAVVRALARAQTETESRNLEIEKVKVVASRLVGAMVTGPASAGLVGYLENRFPAKDGSRATLGPIPLSAAVGTLALTASLAFPGAANQLAYVAAANNGLAAGTYMRGIGAAQRAKALAKRGGTAPAPGQPPRIGYAPDDYRRGYIGASEDNWTPEERELLGT